MRISRTLGLVGAAALILTVAGAAQAETDGKQVSNAKHTFQMEALHYDNATGNQTATDDSSIHWINTDKDSPTDGNTRALKVKVAAGDESGNDFADAYTNASLNIDKRVSDVRNLSYEFAGRVGGGAPRFSVQFTNGDVAYLASSACAQDIAVSTTWKRSDFTGATDNCAINVSGTTGGVYAADGTHTAWEVYAFAHPSQFVSQAYLVFDEAGVYKLDRIALGTNRLYNNRPNLAVNCHGEEGLC
jgi:hypothetical protein